jgi:Arginine-tRNA-protein transferase, C terminus
MRRWQDFVDGKEISPKIYHEESKRTKSVSSISMSEEPIQNQEFESDFLSSLKQFLVELRSEGFPEIKNTERIKVFPDKTSPNSIIVTNALQILYQDAKAAFPKLDTYLEQVTSSSAYKSLAVRFPSFGMTTDKKGFIRLSKPVEQKPDVAVKGSLPKSKGVEVRSSKPTGGVKEESGMEGLDSGGSESKQKHKFEIRMEEPGFRTDKQAVVHAYQRGGLGFGIPGGVSGAGSFKGVANAHKTNGAHILQLGSKHMCYYLDDKLVGLGVVDLSDTMLCSLFFVYDPILKPYSFGILSVLFEIQFVADKHKHFPDFAYQNLGAFELDNQKMEYKMNFRPAELLCPYSMQFVDFDQRVQQSLETRQNKICPDHVTARNQAEEFLTVDEIKPFLKQNVSIEMQGKLQKCSSIQEAVLDRVCLHYEGVFIALGKTLTKMIGFRFGNYSNSGDSDEED